MTSGSQAGPAALAFTAELDRLVQELWTWSLSRFTPPRTAALHDLAAALVHISRESGTGVPPDVSPPRLASHGLADQLAVLGADVLRAAERERAATKALERLAATRAALLPPQRA